ncbi:MAG: Flp pilus assembly complex ATPase component TadA [Rubrobacteridae bacterium]|nr:Flp pilus assembly complex ATPase component TadA [Rubrobacteridae bacterium]
MAQSLRNTAPKIRLGEMLVKYEMITQAQLEEALFEQKKSGKRLGDTLRDLGFASEETLIEFLGKQLDIPSIDLDQTVVDEEVVKIIPEAIARKYKMIAVARIDNILTLAMSDPLDLFALDDAKSITNCQIVTVVTTEKSIQKALDKFYWMQGAEKECGTGAMSAESDSGADLDNAESDAARFIEMILKQALVDKASDIHIEISEHEVRVRIRVDGVLHQAMTAPKAIHSSIMSRLKIMSDLNIAEKRAPQDGRFSVRANGHKIDFRLSTVPTIFGEKAVMRLLEKKEVCVDQEKLGFSKDELTKFRRLINSSYGMILVAGPTGSGKTTTLYTALNALATVEKNIITIEDPVEYTFDMINQIQVNPKAGVTFAGGLRAVLRQDPDVIMVGEIRDEETSEIAIHSALSGHLVLSTIHTNDAPSTPARFIEMGIQPFLVATATIGVISQRLVRVLCPSCKEPYQPVPELLQDLGLPTDGDYVFYKAKGCTECRGVGYKGRQALFEILEIDNEIKDLIVSKSPPASIRAAATKQNFKTLRDSGIAKVVEGTTTLEVVMKATQDVS